MDIFPYDAVVFDLDGTLFDAEEGIVSSVRRAMDEMGLEVPADADLREVVGPPLADSFRDLLGVPEARVQEAVDRYRRDFSARGMYLYSVYPNIRSILRMLHEAGVHVGLATSKPLRLARDILSYFALDGDFDRIVGEEDAAAKLGKAELIRRALPDRFRRAAMVGDRKFDMAGALANGIEGIGAGYGCGTEEELTVAGASVVVPDTEGLRAVLCPGGEIPARVLPHGGRPRRQRQDHPDRASGKAPAPVRLQRAAHARAGRLRHQRGHPPHHPRHGQHRHVPRLRGAALRRRARPARQPGHPPGGGAGDAGAVRPVRGQLRGLSGRRTRAGRGNRAADQRSRRGRHDPRRHALSGHRPPEALRRRLSASEPDRLELEAGEFHERVQKAYERLVRDNRRRFVVVDAARGVDEVARDALDAVLERLLPDRRA